MWSPENYYSWSDVWNLLSDATELTMSLAFKAGETEYTSDGVPHFGHTAEFYLKSAGLADGYADAELIVGITTTMLLVRFLEEYPPTLANLDGNMIRADQFLFDHRDQLDLCQFDWPIKDMAEFHGFFALQKEGRFNTRALLDRFTFIDFEAGEIRHKNGGRHQLINYIGCDEAEADRIVALVERLSGYVICWPEFPKGPELRDFLSHLDMNDIFALALDKGFGPPSDRRCDSNLSRQTKPRGRPRKTTEAARIYWEIFPEGHDQQGKTWKEALALVSDNYDGSIQLMTLKRAVRDTQ